MVISKFADTFIEPVVVGVFTAIISVVSSDNDIIVLRGERDVNPLVVSAGLATVSSLVSNVISNYLIKEAKDGENEEVALIAKPLIASLVNVLGYSLITDANSHVHNREMMWQTILPGIVIHTILETTIYGFNKL